MEFYGRHFIHVARVASGQAHDSQSDERSRESSFAVKTFRPRKLPEMVMTHDHEVNRLE